MNIKKWLPVVVFVLLTVFAGAALAEGNVAKIGATEYANFDDALKAAQNGDTIELLQNAVTDNGINLNNELTVDGGASKYKLTFASKGIALWSGSSLTFQNCKVEMMGIGATPYKEWNWMAIQSQNGILNLTNAEMTMDGTGTATNATATHAIYYESSNGKFGQLNLTDSRLEIRNYSQDALEWDGGDGGYYFNLTRSTFVSDKNRSGVTGTFVVTAKDSNFTVINSRGNGSNGSHFDFDNCKVEFNNNGGHGISASRLTVKDSTLDAKNNAYTGVTFLHNGTFTNSTVTITGTKGTLGSSASFRLGSSAAVGTVDKNTKLTIQDNQAPGIWLMKAGAKLTIEEGAQVLVTRNHAEQAIQMGAGINVISGSTATLSNSTQIYNNHALLAGDDLYVENGGKLTFGKTGSGWKLDGDPDCTDAITGWYDDAKDARWEAHASDDENHIVLVDAGAYEAPLALKAAHGVLPPAPTAAPTAAPVPQTGDHTPLHALYALLALSLTAALVLTLRRKAQR